MKNMSNGMNLKEVVLRRLSQLTSNCSAGIVWGGILYLFLSLCGAFLISDRSAAFMAAFWAADIAVGFLLLLACEGKRKSERLRRILSMMMNTTGGCYWEWDVTDGKFSLRPQGSVLFGKDVHAFDELVSLIHPDDAFKFVKAAEQFRASGDELNIELRIQSAKGDWRWFLIRSNVALRSRDGKIVRIVGTMVDIDAHRQLVDAVRVSEKRLSTIFRSAPGSMAVTDREGHLLDANQAFYDMLGYGVEELQGVSIMSLSENYRDRDSAAIMTKIIQECESHEDRRFYLEEDFMCSNGKKITLEFGLSPILDFDGNVQNYIFSGTDITQQKKRAAELKLLAENQRWLFDFSRQFNQFQGIDQLFEALKENLPNVISFSTLKLIVPSFLDKEWIKSTSDTHRSLKENENAIAELKAGEGPFGESYTTRTAVTLGDFVSGPDDSQACVHSVLVIPLLYKEKTWGVMALESNVRHAFSDQDVTLMNIVGSNIGLYFEEQSNRAELDTNTDRLEELHTLIHTLLRTRNRDHLFEGMLGYLKSAVSDSACAVYFWPKDREGKDTELVRLAWYDGENVSLPASPLVLKAIIRETPLMEYDANGVETRRVSPIMFHTNNVGAIDLYKPSGLQQTELKMYQLLVDYVAGFWMLYDLMALREEEASVDPLTGIWNRRYMIRRLQEESDRISRYGGNAGVVIGDMGNFKHTNDNFGHIKGDEVLVKTADALRKTIRFSDSVGRFGGDEFIILLPNVTQTDADAVIERMKLELEQIRIRSDDTLEDSPFIEVVVDFGLALFPGGAETLMETINLADEAMYANKIKRKGKAAQILNIHRPLAALPHKTTAKTASS